MSVKALTTHEPAASNADKLTEQVKMELDRAGNLSNVSIQFQVNDQSKELTVFVIDRKSKRVLRSIPASELHKLQAGDLLKMTA